LNQIMNDTGFEIRHQENLREHYSKTLAAWCANLDAHWDEAVKEVGQGTARVWRLYMAGSQLGFDTTIVQLHQSLGVSAHAEGASGMPLRPDGGPLIARAAAQGCPSPPVGGLNGPAPSPPSAGSTPAGPRHATIEVCALGGLSLPSRAGFY